VGGGAHPVQDDAGDVYVGVERRVPVDHRGGRAGHGPGVHDEDDGRVEEFGDVGGRGEISAALAVEEAHDALYHGDVRAIGAVGEERGDEIQTGEEGVEVAARPSRGEGVVGGVYKVRAHLEGGDAEAPLRERGHEARGDGGLAGPRVGARDHYARGPYHSMPFWPR
jgi:hypothetical protein